MLKSIEPVRSVPFADSSVYGLLTALWQFLCIGANLKQLTMWPWLFLLFAQSRVYSWDHCGSSSVCTQCHRLLGLLSAYRSHRGYLTYWISPSISGWTVAGSNQYHGLRQLRICGSSRLPRIVIAGCPTNTLGGFPSPSQASLLHRRQ